MTRHVIRFGKLTLGIACLGLGVVGLFLPFLQGILFVVIGLSLLSSESDRARRLLEWLRQRVGRNRLKRGETVDG
jgi:uncharacterized membrane protein YbaN (DUF454 family)